MPGTVGTSSRSSVLTGRPWNPDEREILPTEVEDREIGPDRTLEQQRLRPAAAAGLPGYGTYTIEGPIGSVRSPVSTRPVHSFPLTALTWLISVKFLIFASSC